MGNDVFANGREISCKAADGKAVAAFPDVCMTPPENPATPPGVPIPYPNTGFAKDATAGSKTVKISNKEVMLKNKSHFKTSTGDEAGCAAKKGVITSKIKGKIYFNSWSMDVKVEGKNAVRHLDMTTHNHGSFPGQTPTWPYLDGGSAAGTACEGLEELELQPHRRSKCPSGSQAHHVIPHRQMKGKPDYSYGLAPTICAEGTNQHDGQHGELHAYTDTAEYDAAPDYTYKQSKETTKKSIREVKQIDSDKVDECMELQLNNYYQERCKIKDGDKVNAKKSRRGKNMKRPETSVSAGDG